MRVLRLVLGVFVIIQAFISHDWKLGILGAVFTALPLLNIGCCGACGCSVPLKKENDASKEISYEEVV